MHRIEVKLSDLHWLVVAQQIVEFNGDSRALLCHYCSVEKGSVVEE
jgi:hypothetical protein